MLPTVLRDWWGFFIPRRAMTPLNAVVVIDYQNIHLTAHEKFGPPGIEVHNTLIHPLHFAQQVLAVRERRLAAKAMTSPGDSEPYRRATLAGVKVFRGAPSNHEHPTLYKYSQAQRSEWTRDPRVEVEYRTLKYYWEKGVRVSQEKGIDVRVALTVARVAMQKDADLVILASHDTDLEPAIDAANDWSDGVLVETAGWDGCRRLRGKPPVRHTSLDQVAFVHSRDRKQYS